jgi:trimeric autotransporter adhesin
VEITAIGYQALRNSTGNSNTAIGHSSLITNTSGVENTAVGYASLRDNTIGGRNTAIGKSALLTNTTGSSNSALGQDTNSGNFDASVIIGRGATATASNQFVVGSAAYNAGAVTAEVNTSANVWNVIINGVAQKILLA